MSTLHVAFDPDTTTMTLTLELEGDPAQDTDRVARLISSWTKLGITVDIDEVTPEPASGVRPAHELRRQLQTLLDFVPEEG